MKDSQQQKYDSDLILLLFEEKTPLASYGGKTAQEIKRDFLNSQATEVYRDFVSPNKRPEEWEQFSFAYDDAKELALQLKAIRSAVGITQVQLSAFGLSRSYLSQAEIGHLKGYSYKAGEGFIYRYLSSLREAAKKELLKT